MPRDFIYCATDRQVPPNETQRLLLGQFNAIWCPPLRLPTLPSQHDRVWLVWRPHLAAKTSPLILGGGRISADPNGAVLWTEKTLQGVTRAAQSLGYGGPPAPRMTFLKLTGVVSPAHHLPVTLIVKPGLSDVAAQPVGAQALTALTTLLKIP